MHRGPRTLRALRDVAVPSIAAAPTTAATEADLVSMWESYECCTMPGCMWMGLCMALLNPLCINGDAKLSCSDMERCHVPASEEDTASLAL